MLYRLADRPGCTLQQVGSRLKVDPAQLEASIDTLITAGLLRRDGRQRTAASGVQGLGVFGSTGEDGGSDGANLVLTPAGQDAIERLTAARRDSMTELLEGWDPEAHPEVIELVRDLARALMADDDKLLAEARAAAV